MANSVNEIIIVTYLNSTANEHEYRTEFFNNLSIILCIIVIFVNFLVVLSSGFLLKKGQQPRATYIYLGNISLSDMLIGIVTLFVALNPYQFHSNFMCSFMTSLGVTAALASVYGIGLIAIDRYLYIIYGLHYHRYFTTRHSHCMVSLIWLLGVVLGFVVTCFVRSPIGEEACWYIILVPGNIALFVIFIETIPMILIIVLYSIILKNAINTISRNSSISHLETNSRNLPHSFRDGRAEITSCSVNDQLPSSPRIPSFGLPCCRRNSISLAMRPTFCKNKWKAVKIVVFTTGAYVVTWFPTFVTWILYANCDKDTDAEYCENLEDILINPMSLLILSNSLLDPVIYAWWHPGFRDSAKKMYSMLLRRRKSSTNTSRTSEPKTSSLNRKGEF